MSSPFSTDRRALCQHADYRVGCLSCSAEDMRSALQEAVAESSSRAQSMRVYQALLADTALRASDKEHLVAKLERATKQSTAWYERCQVLKEMVASVEAQVKDVCDCTDPDALSEAFEHNAMEHEDRLRQIWRNAAKGEGDGEFIRFCPEDPTYELSSKDIDRSNIPATADTLVSSGIGLQVFLKAGKDTQRLPNQSVGEQTDPAIMSYGRALEMFGVPDGPGKDWRQASKPSTGPVEREMLAQVDATKTTSKAEKQEATTEYDYRRLRDVQPPTTPLLSEDKQWALFGSRKHMSDAAILARQYAKLVADKNSNEDDGGWPPVDQLDWAGFTNWVHRCKQVDKTFGRETLPSWNKQRAQRQATIRSQLEAWVPPPGFDDGLSSHQPPTHFYTGTPLGILDAKKLGLDLQPAKR